jgi:hypothetical protein
MNNTLPRSDAAFPVLRDRINLDETDLNAFLALANSSETTRIRKKTITPFSEFLAAFRRTLSEGAP